MSRISRRTLVAACALAACGGPGGTTVTPPPPVPGDSVAAWVTTADQGRLLTRDQDFTFRSGTFDAGLTSIGVDTATRYQTIVGWGAAMTDASAYLIQTKLSATQRETLLQELFGRDPGVGFSFVRVTMGASDFSRTHYTYDDVAPGDSDMTLAHFSLAPDSAEKIPVLQRARAINPQLAVVGSPWSPPAWMKTSGSLIGGTLRADRYAPFADYFRRWIEGYAAAGIPIFAITLQNEPHFEPADYPGMRLDETQRATLVKSYVGPLFAQRSLTTRILDWDHNWDEPNAPLAVLGDAAARAYVAGVAWHCYAGDVSVEAAVHQQYPDKETYFTECSGGEWDPNWGTNLAWDVSKMVIGNARGWSRGVALWNLALDENHGPHLGGCGNCRGVITINSATGLVTRNPEYYALAHASRFVRPGAVRIESTASNGLETVAFRNADDGSRVLIVLNDATAARDFVVKEGTQGFTYTLPAGAVATFVWR